MLSSGELPVSSLEVLAPHFGELSAPWTAPALLSTLHPRFLLGALGSSFLDLLPWGWGGGRTGRGYGRLFCGPWPVLARDWPCPTTSLRISPQSRFLCTSQFKTSVVLSRVRSARSRQEPYCSRLHCIFPLPSLLVILATSTLLFNHNVKYIFIEKNPHINGPTQFKPVCSRVTCIF